MSFNIKLATVLLILLLTQVLMGFQTSTEKQEDIKVRGYDEPGVHQKMTDNTEMRDTLIESHEFGGSWLDDFEDEKGMDRATDDIIIENGAVGIREWDLPDWKYRRSIEIVERSGSHLTDFQVPITIDSGNFNFSRILLNGSDIRFVDDNGNPLDFWIEKWNITSGCKIWVKVKDLTADSITTIWMYHGNPRAPNKSDGHATFVFFEDAKDYPFNQTNPGGWFIKSETQPNQEIRIWPTLRGNRKAFYVTLIATSQFGTTESTVACKKVNLPPDSYDVRIYMDPSYHNKTKPWYGNLSVDGTKIFSENISSWTDFTLANGTYQGSITDLELETLYTLCWDGNWAIFFDDIAIRKHIPREPIVIVKPESSYFISKDIEKPAVYLWDILSISKDETSGTHINISVINNATGAIIPGFENLTHENIDLSPLNQMDLTSINLKANFGENYDNSSPVMYSWGVEWIAENAWRDSFIGNGKLIGDFNISGGQLLLSDNQLLPEPGMVGLWDFDEGRGNILHDRSGNGNNGSLQNMDKNDWVKGIRGKALEFDGIDDCVSISDSDIISVEKGDFTLEAWIKTTQVHSDPNGIVILNKYPDGYDPWTMRIGSDGRIRFICDENIYSAEPVNDGVWHHIAALRSGQIIKLYVDGVLTDTGTSTTMNDTSLEFYIGATHNYLRNYEGIIDEVAIYNRALTTQEIIAHSKLIQYNASVRSQNIEIAEGKKWNSFQANRFVPENAYLNISVHDANTGEVLIRNTQNTKRLVLDMSGINPSEHRDIYLQAYFQSSQSESPILYDWGIQTIKSSPKPVAVAGDDITIEPHEIAQFDGSGSYDDNGIINYTWSFFYSGEIIYLFGEKVEFRFVETGYFYVTLNVSDADGLWGIDELMVFVGDTIPPVAHPGPDLLVDQYTSVAFDGSASSDNIGIANFTWALEYGGKVILLYGVNVSFNFSLPGLYEITLRVVDFHDNWAENSTTIQVRDIEKPTARAGKDIEVVPGEPVFLNGNGSSDNVGIENYSWIFGYNNRHIQLYGQKTSFKFDELGDYLVILLVRDLEGNVGTDTLMVFVKEDEEPPRVQNDTDSDGWTDAEEKETGSDPYDNRSTPLDWDGDGVPNGQDAYPRDPGRWTKKKEFRRLKIAVYLGLGVIVLLICFIGYTRIGYKKIFQNGKREKICSYIRQNPGMHFRELSRKLEINSSTLEHHIRKLKEAEVINTVYDGYFMRCYYGNSLNHHKPLTPMQEKIVNLIGNQSGITYKELIQKMNLSYVTISYHLATLSDKGVVLKERKNGVIHLYVKKH